MPEPVSEGIVARPAGPLRALVAAHHGYRQRDVPAARHLGLPSPYLTLIFTLDEPMRMAQHVDPAQPPGSYRALIGGLHTSPAVIEHDGAQSGIQLQLSPLGVRALLGVPAGALADLDLHLTDLLGRLGDDLQEQAQAAPTWTARFRLLDEQLGRLVDPARRPPDEVRHAWHLLFSSGGTARIAEVARAVGWSERHLAARFRTEIGLTPKTAARVIRFHRARLMIPSTPGATVAAVCGYADQAHLVRDFSRVTGTTPGRFAARHAGGPSAAPPVALPTAEGGSPRPV